MKKRILEKTEALWIAALIGCTYIDLSYARTMTFCMLLISLFSLGLPESFRRAQAMMLSRGKVTFAHILSLLLCGVATAGLALSGRFNVIYVVLSGLCTAQLLAGIALRSKRKYALATLSDAVSTAILLIPALQPLHLRAVLLISEGWALITTLLSLTLSPRGAPSPGWGLAKEMPGALFVQAYYPILSGFSLMMFLSSIDQSGVDHLDEEHIAGYLVGLLLFTLFRPLFRREETEMPWVLAIVELCAVIAGFAALMTLGRLDEFLEMPIFFLFIAGGCALTVYYAPTWKNIVTELLWIAVGMYGVMMWSTILSEFAVLAAGVLLGVAFQIGGIRDAIHKLMLKRKKSRT